MHLFAPPPKKKRTDAYLLTPPPPWFFIIRIAVLLFVLHDLVQEGCVQLDGHDLRDVDLKDILLERL